MRLRVSTALVPLLVLCMDSMHRVEGKLLMDRTPENGDYLWLEELEGQKALDWVRQQNTRSIGRLHADPLFDRFKSEALSILEAKDKIPGGQIIGDFVYNFWQDADHVRGIWRRTSWDSYRFGNFLWEDVLDIDALAKIEGKSYVFRGVKCLKPKNQRCLVTLSEGGTDAAQVREFDLVAKTFVAEGFKLAPSKSRINWFDEDTLLVADASQAAPKTDSGYPMQVKLWKRGTPLAEAPVIFKGEQSDVAVDTFVFQDSNLDRTINHVLMVRADTFFTEELSYYKDGLTTRIPLPSDVDVKGLLQGQLLFVNRTPLAGFKAGSLLAAPLDKLLQGQVSTELLFAPTSTQAVNSVMIGKDFAYVNLMENVRSRLLRFQRLDQQWVSKPLPMGEDGTLALDSVDLSTNRLLIYYEDFLTPTGLWAMDGGSLEKQRVAQLPPRFNANDLVVRQEFAKSNDGVMIPYFLVHRRDLLLNGKNPTLLYGYGGFEVSMQPTYLNVTGKLWLEKGGVYALANIRGGGEFGPAWHQAALKENRQVAFDDFVSVARDLFAAKVTSPQHLGIQGGSNGGLLMGVSMTQHPELFSAVVCQVPLLDMLRYHKLLAGASWVAEFGNPDIPEDEVYIKRYSPFQHLKNDVVYPEVFFMTSTKDDRVHPAHARKMAARMADMKHPFLYFENIEGGHSASANLQQLAERQALTMVYLWQKLFHH